MMSFSGEPHGHVQMAARPEWLKARRLNPDGDASWLRFFIPLWQKRIDPHQLALGIGGPYP